MSVSFSPMPVPIFMAGRASDDGGAPIRRPRPSFVADASRAVSSVLPDDAALADRLRSGDVPAFDQVYLTHYAALVDFARAYVHDTDAAEDVVQEVFRRLWETRAQFAPHGSVRAYLFGAVRNGAMNHRRHDRVVVAAQREGAAAAGAGAAALRPDETMLVEDAMSQVARELSAMAEERRRILALRWRHGLGFAEIGAILGLSEAAARAQVSRAHRLLAAIIGERV